MKLKKEIKILENKLKKINSDNIRWQLILLKLIKYIKKHKLIS